VYGIRVTTRKAGEKKARWEVYSNRQREVEQRVPVAAADYIIWADPKWIKLPGDEQLRPSSEVSVHIYSNERADTGLHLQ
jgi:hypothetical protein